MEGLFNPMTLTDVIAKVTRYAKRIIVTDNSSSDAVRITQLGSGNALVVEDSTNPDATPFVVKSDGRVGIGVLNPEEKLDIDGAVKALSAEINRPTDIWQDAAYYNVGGTTLRQGALYHHSSFQVNLVSNGYRNNSGTWTSYNVNGDTGAAIVSLDPAGSIFLGTEASKATGSSINVTTRMTVASNGNVGIGTISPAKTLHVNGTVRLQGLPTYANNAAAIAGGLVADDVYKTNVAGEVQLRIVI
jgi:hypothetical protein